MSKFIQFTNGLKSSKRDLFAEIPNLINKKVDDLVNKISHIMQVPDSAPYWQGEDTRGLLAAVCTDSSLVNRTEYKLLEPYHQDNKRLAYLGDAYLSYFLAKHCYSQNKNQCEYQSMRTSLTNKDSLAVIYDTYFTDCLITFDLIINNQVNPSNKQKCEFVEAAMGAIYLLVNDCEIEMIDEKSVDVVAKLFLNL